MSYITQSICFLLCMPLFLYPSTVHTNKHSWRYFLLKFFILQKVVYAVFRRLISYINRQYEINSHTARYLFVYRILTYNTIVINLCTRNRINAYVLTLYMYQWPPLSIIFIHPIYRVSERIPYLNSKKELPWQMATIINYELTTH